MSIYLTLTYILGTLLFPIHNSSPIPLFPPCSQEDGSSPNQQFPCAWDATTQGNGRGTSYILFDPPIS